MVDTHNRKKENRHTLARNDTKRALSDSSSSGSSAANPSATLARPSARSGAETQRCCTRVRTGLAPLPPFSSSSPPFFCPAATTGVLPSELPPAELAPGVLPVVAEGAAAASSPLPAPTGVADDGVDSEVCRLFPCSSEGASARCPGVVEGDDALALLSPLSLALASFAFLRAAAMALVTSIALWWALTQSRLLSA